MLDATNLTYGTNIQELALAALTGALAELQGSAEGHKLHLMLEGHGREPWNSDIDISNTVGWFTSMYPVVFTSSNDISMLLRQIKQKLRAVPEKGLSYGALKYLVPNLESPIKSHRSHNISFNYLGRFQEMKAENGMFEVVQDIYVPQTAADESSFTPGDIGLSHVGPELVLDISAPEWLFSQQELNQWVQLWSSWMHRIIE